MYKNCQFKVVQYLKKTNEYLMLKKNNIIQSSN